MGKKRSRWRLPFKTMRQLPEIEQVIRRLRIVADEADAGHGTFLWALSRRIKELENSPQVQQLCAGGWLVGQEDDL